MLTTQTMNTRMLTEPEYDEPGDRFMFDFSRYVMNEPRKENSATIPITHVKVPADQSPNPFMGDQQMNCSTEQKPIDTSQKSGDNSRSTKAMSVADRIMLEDEYVPLVPLSTEPAHVVFKDSGLETEENLRQYYTVLRYVSRQPNSRSAHIFKCNICSKTTRQFCNFKSHVRTHLDLKPYCCSICGKGFTTSSNLSLIHI